ncbi:hypothetical protein C8R46DRAFT_1346698 [Mycena filopes]|nr:hypothetical protein C8R46DRAFT_1346698 [Mycena filopes]
MQHQNSSGSRGKYDGVELPLDSSMTLLPNERKAAPPYKAQSTTALRWISFALHSVIVAVHIALVVVWSKRLEHQVVFSLEHQQIVSFVITAVSTAIGTIYSALLVFLTQSLSMRRSLRMNQTLTAIHDTTAAWSGIGAAVVYLWHQTFIRGSIIGVLSVFMYLGNILVLHISTPALFSVATFNSSHQITIETTNQVPQYRWTADDPMDQLNFLLYLSRSSLNFPAALTNASHDGLHEGTLYDILADNVATGDVQVNATGFNITCGYPTQISTTPRPANTTFTDVVVDGLSFSFNFTQPGIITPLTPAAFPLILYSTVPIVDSSNTHPPLLEVDPPMDNGISSVQILKCHQIAVPQIAFVDAQSHALNNLQPNIRKSSSTWAPYSGPTVGPKNPSTEIDDNFMIENWPRWYGSGLPSIFPLYASISGVQTSTFLSVIDMTLIQLLNLHTPDYQPNTTTVLLHDLENALSSIAAAMFWSLVHLPPTFGTIETIAGTIPAFTALLPIGEGPFLLPGTATATAVSPQGRLNLNIIAIAAGLAASIGLWFCALPTWFIPRGAKNLIAGTGILHAIWLYRDHEDLATRLPQVEHPTIDNLREAGNIRVKLLEGDSESVS